MAAAWCGSIVFGNLSLLLNSVGFYQSMKLLLSPVLIVWQYVFFRIVTHPHERWALVPLIIGIGMITVNGIGFSAVGLVVSILQLISTAAVQTWVQRKQKAHTMDSIQLLHNNAFFCIIFLAPIAPLVDYVTVSEWVFDRAISFQFVVALGISGFFALGLNIAAFLVIGISGPVVFQVVGFFKTMLIFVGGVVIFNEPINTQKGLGMAIALAGLAIYSYVKHRLKTKKPGQAATGATGKGQASELELLAGSLQANSGITRSADAHQLLEAALGSSDEDDSSLLDENDLEPMDSESLHQLQTTHQMANNAGDFNQEFTQEKVGPSKPAEPLPGDDWTGATESTNLVS